MWIPLFYFFRRSISAEGGAGGILAIILGLVTALIQVFIGNLVDPGGFGMSRWMNGFVDIVGLPVLIPLFVYLVFIIFRSFSGNIDFANFALLWLIPVSILKAFNWSASGSPITLIIVPLLWTALAVGIPLFINCIISFSRWYVYIPCGIGIAALPIAAVTAYWALFSQQNLLGWLLFAAAMIPMLVSVILDYVKSR